MPADPPLPAAADAIAALAARGDIAVRALLLGERLDLRRLDRAKPLATAPLALALPETGGVAVLFRYGAAVLFGADDGATARLLAALAPFVAEPFPSPETETARLRIGPGAPPAGDEGAIALPHGTIEHLQLIADVLAKSLVLARYETVMAAMFDRIEPLAAELRARGRVNARGRQLLRQIGVVLGIQHRMVGRAETAEKPELLWDHPELEPLHRHLAEDYELRERDRALDRKLDLAGRTVATLLGLVQARSSLRVEWYIVALILAELGLALYALPPLR
jgi:uncharacterized Rmd1/YagE family protein